MQDEEVGAAAIGRAFDGDGGGEDDGRVTHDQILPLAPGKDVGYDGNEEEKESEVEASLA